MSVSEGMSPWKISLWNAGIQVALLIISNFDSRNQASLKVYSTGDRTYTLR